jgi:hypothetical protein
MTETREIVISNNAGGIAPGTLHIRHFSGGERLRRALAVLGMCWGVGLATVIIPLVHFVVPPVMLIIGPVLAWRRYGVVMQNEKIVGSCPSCGQPVTLELDASDSLPLWTYCPPSDDPIRVLDAHEVAAA